MRTGITLGGTTVFSGDFAQTFPAGGPGDLKTLATISPPAGTKLKGFSLAGSVSLMIGKDATGAQQDYARFELIVKLPDAFRNGPGQAAGGLTGTAAIRTDASGVHADTLKLEVTDAYVGQVLLKNVCLSYVASASPATPCQAPKFGATPLLECRTAGTDRWDGSALIQLPTADKPEVGLFAGVSNGSFAYAGAQVTSLGTAAPLAPGVYLDKVGLAICLNPAPMTIKGSVGIRFGPSFNGTQAAYLDGSLKYTDSRPWVLEATGSLSLYGKNVANGYLTYKSDNAIDFGFNVSWDFYGLLSLGWGQWVVSARPQLPRLRVESRQPCGQGAPEHLPKVWAPGLSHQHFPPPAWAWLHPCATAGRPRRLNNYPPADGPEVRGGGVRCLWLRPRVRAQVRVHRGRRGGVERRRRRVRCADGGRISRALLLGRTLARSPHSCRGRVQVGQRQPCGLDGPVL